MHSFPTRRSSDLVTSQWPPIAQVEILPEPGRLYAGVTLAHRSRAVHADQSERKNVAVTWRSSNEAVATVDRFGNVTARRPGAVTITAEAEGASASIRHTVVANPVASLTIAIH